MSKAEINISEGVVEWKSPSNIALIKYWGKKENQIPVNPSISLSLSKSYTQTKIEFSLKQGETQIIEFALDRKKNPLFANRIQKFIEEIGSYLPIVHELNFKFSSRNTFPHSSGIASSASGFSALALGLCTIERNASVNPVSDSEFLQKASFISRLGSGSACRSVYGGATLWGRTSLNKQSTDEYAIPISLKNFKKINDAILIVSSGKKKISSSQGHNAMRNHPYAQARLNQANHNLQALLEADEKDDFPGFASIIENEALSLHALMMTSNPGFILLEPGSLKIIEEIQDFRNQTNAKICYTIDAGPNIHLLYLESEKSKVTEFINSRLVQYLENGNWIDDTCGDGPELLNYETNG